MDSQINISYFIPGYHFLFLLLLNESVPAGFSFLVVYEKCGKYEYVWMHFLTKALSVDKGT